MLCVAVFVSQASGILTKAEFCFFHCQPACKKKLDPEAVDLIGFRILLQICVGVSITMK